MIKETLQTTIEQLKTAQQKEVDKAVNDNRINVVIPYINNLQKAATEAIAQIDKEATAKKEEIDAQATAQKEEINRKLISSQQAYEANQKSYVAASVEAKYKTVLDTLEKQLKEVAE